MLLIGYATICYSTDEILISALQNMNMRMTQLEQANPKDPATIGMLMSLIQEMAYFNDTYTHYQTDQELPLETSLSAMLSNSHSPEEDHVILIQYLKKMVNHFNSYQNS